MKKAVSEKLLNRLLDDMNVIWQRLYAASLPFQEDLGPRGIWVLRRINLGDVYPSDLARELAVSPSLLTQEIARLVDMGMLRREASPDDGRRRRLSLTQLGLNRLAECYDALERMLAPVFDNYSDAERATFFELLEDLSAINPPQQDEPRNDKEELQKLERENRRLKEALAKLQAEKNGD